jgi:hypothetical protein
MNIINNPENFLTNEDQWWMIYEAETKKIMIEPQQCSGYTSSPLTMVISDSKEELEQYIMSADFIF